jgi:hypothetical protein
MVYILDDRGYVKVVEDVVNREIVVIGKKLENLKFLPRQYHLSCVI